MVISREPLCVRSESFEQIIERPCAIGRLMTKPNVPSGVVFDHVDDRFDEARVFHGFGGDQELSGERFLRSAAQAGGTRIRSQAEARARRSRRRMSRRERGDTKSIIVSKPSPRYPRTLRSDAFDRRCG